MPQVYFYGVLTLVTAMLNARRRFTAAAFAPVMNNLVVIAMFLTLPAVAHGDLLGPDPLGVAQDEWRVLFWLGLGTTLGVAASAVVVVPSLADPRLGLRFNLAGATRSSAGWCGCPAGPWATWPPTRCRSWRRCSSPTS